MEITIWDKDLSAAKNAAAVVTDAMTQDGWSFVSARTKTDDVGAPMITIRFARK